MDHQDLLNIEHTQKIYELCQVPKNNRQDDWVASFFHYIPTASLSSTDPQLISGPDKFPYFVLNLPTSNESFEAYSLAHILEHLTSNGLGLVINPLATDQPDWIFSFGDLWNYRETNIFIFDRARYENSNIDEKDTNSKERRVLVAQPSQKFLPNYVRRIIDLNLKERFGIQSPKMFLMTDMSLNPSTNLVFNIFSHEHDDAKIQDIANFLAWALPRDYGLVAIDQNSELAINFQPVYNL